MSENLFEKLQRIEENQEKVQQQMQQDKEDILSALSKQKPPVKHASQAAPSQKASADPTVIEFVKTAKRVWRYCGEYSDFNRNLKKVKKRGIIYLLLLSFQLALPFLLVSATPYAWILVAINSMLCLGYGTYNGYRFFKKREYEIPYDKSCGFGQHNEYDDNGIVISTENGALLKVFKLLTELMPAVIMLFSFFCLGTAGGLITFILCLTRIPLSAARFSDSEMDYVLYFVDDKNEIEYHFLKDFMKRNKLK